MQKSTIINFCESWKLLLEPLCDTDFQRRSWFRLEGSEVSTFEEAIGNVKERYSDDIITLEYQLLYANEYRDLIKQLYEKICQYTADDYSLLNAVNEERLLNDPNWLSIVALSMKIYDVLNRKIREVENVER